MRTRTLSLLALALLSPGCFRSDPAAVGNGGPQIRVDQAERRPEPRTPEEQIVRDRIARTFVGLPFVIEEWGPHVTEAEGWVWPPRGSPFGVLPTPGDRRKPAAFLRVADRGDNPDRRNPVADHIYVIRDGRIISTHLNDHGANWITHWRAEAKNVDP